MESIDVNFRDECILRLQDYGPMQESRIFDIHIEGKERKYIKLISDSIVLDLVDILYEKVGYRFFFFEDDIFYGRVALGTKWKKEIYYANQELKYPSFLFDLFHEAGHFPINYGSSDVEEEKKARRNAISLSIILKHQYNFCILAGFSSYEEVYEHIHKYLSTYYK